MAFFATDNYPNGYQPKVPMPEVKPPKCGSAESSSAADKSNIELLDELYSENAKLRKKLKKVRKEKKKWKHKYLELYNLMETMTSKNICENKDSTVDSTMDRIKAGLGIPPL